MSTSSNQPEEAAESILYNFVGFGSYTVELHEHIVMLNILAYYSDVVRTISDLRQICHGQQFLVVVNANISVLLDTFHCSCLPKLILLKPHLAKSPITKVPPLCPFLLSFRRPSASITVKGSSHLEGVVLANLGLELEVVYQV